MTVDGSTFESENLAFFTKVSAEISHELSNVVAVIGELSGLIEDLVAADRADRPISLDKLQATAQKIGRQVARGKETISHFNRFAHSADTPLEALDLLDLLPRFAVLSKRFVERRRARLDLVLPDEPVTITSNAFLLFRMLFAALNQVMSENAAVIVSLRADAKIATITIEGSGDEKGALPVSASEELSGVVAKLDSTFRAVDVGSGWTICLPRGRVPPA